MPNLRNSGDLQISYFQEQGAPVPAAPPAPPPPPQEDLRVDFLEAAAEKHVAEIAELQGKFDQLSDAVTGKDTVTPGEVVAIAETVAQTAAEAKDQSEIEGDIYDVEYLPDNEGGGEAENNHSFHFAQTSDTVGSVTSGGVWHDTDAVTLTTAVPATVDCTTNTHFYIKVDWTVHSTYHNGLPEVSWVADIKWPTIADQVDIWPVLEFATAGNASICTERQQSEIHLPQNWMPAINATDNGLFAINDGEITVITASHDFMVLQKKADGTIDFDYPRYNPASP